MSYTPTTWTNGDTITAEKLNKMEQGIAGGSGGGVLIVEMTDVGYSRWDANKTWKEIKDAYISGIPVLIHWPDDDYQQENYNSVLSVRVNTSTYYVHFNKGGNEDTIAANSEDDYPGVTYD